MLLSLVNDFSFVKRISDSESGMWIVFLVYVSINNKTEVPEKLQPNSWNDAGTSTFLSTPPLNMLTSGNSKSKSEIW
jgi:hypothetical protein